MATQLIRTVKRQTFSKDYKGIPLIVSLEAGDMISFRSKGKKNAVSIHLGHCYRLAQILTWDNDYKERMKVYNQKKKAGYTRLRKPKRISPPFNEIYFKSLNGK